MAQIYLVRHTTPNIKPGICYGISDIPLIESFKEEAKSISEKLQGILFDTAFTSPLKRCTQLADILIPGKYKPDSRLVELNFGEWELKPWNEIFDTGYGKEWMNRYQELPCPHGESYLELYNRVKKFIDSSIKSQPTEKKILIITHAGVIRVFLSIFKGLTIDDAFNLKIGFGEVIEIHI